MLVLSQLTQCPKATPNLLVVSPVRPSSAGGEGSARDHLAFSAPLLSPTLLLSILPDHSLSITFADIYTLSHSQCSPHSHLDGRIYLTAEVITGECYKGRAQGPTDWLSRGQVSPGCTGLYWAVLHCTVLAGRDSLLEPGDNWDHLALSQLQILIPYIFSLKVSHKIHHHLMFSPDIHPVAVCAAHRPGRLYNPPLPVQLSSPSLS